MESNRKVTKTVVKSGGRKNKSVTKIPKELSGPIAVPIVGPIVGPIAVPIAVPIERGIDIGIERGIERGIDIGIERGIEGVVENGNTAAEMLGASLTSTWKHFISKESHLALDNIPIHKMNDPHYIHFHIFSVWFLSNMNIPIPNDLEQQFNLQFLHFPFYSSLFHIKLNI